MKKKSTKKIALFGMLIALAFIFSYVESLIPIPIPVPGIKLGLGNIVVIVTLYMIGGKEAGAISLVRAILTGFTFGNLYSIWYGLTGAVFSYGLMVIFKKSGKFSIVGVSIIGGVSHNIGQIIVAVLVLGNVIFYHLPFLLIGGVVSGTLIGLLGALIVSKLKKFKIFYL